MLPVGVHEYEDLAASRPGTALDGRAVAHPIGTRPHPGTVRRGHGGRVISGAVVHDDQLGVGLGFAQPDRKSTRHNSSHSWAARMPSSARNQKTVLYTRHLRTKEHINT